MSENKFRLISLLQTLMSDEEMSQSEYVDVPEGNEENELDEHLQGMIISSVRTHYSEYTL